MEKRELPKDFDWVTALKGCSVAAVFESLLHIAKKNVESMQQPSSDGERWDRPQLTVYAPNGFTVFREGFTKRGVRFHAEQTRIVAEFIGEKREPIRAELTLNDDGDCRLLVDDEELQEWQFLKRVLEPLFFHVDD